MKRVGLKRATAANPRKNKVRYALLLFLSFEFAYPGYSAAADALDLSAYQGKIVVVDFWASWCAPCRQSFPWLNSLHRRYSEQGLMVLGVNVDRERSQAERFLREVPAEFPMIYDPSGALASKYELPGMPTSLVFGPSGELLSTHIGFRTDSSAEREAQLVHLLQHLRDQQR